MCSSDLPRPKVKASGGVPQKMSVGSGPVVATILSTFVMVASGILVSVLFVLTVAVHNSAGMAAPLESIAHRLALW